MNSGFATLYENFLGIFDQQFKLIFYTLFEEGSYTYIGLCFIVPTFILLLIFYYFWSYPYSKLWHWILCIFIIILVTFGLTWSLSNEFIFNSDNQQLINLLSNPESGYEDYALTLPLKYAMWNAVFALFLGFLFSVIMKQFSKAQIHLPF